MALRFDVRIGFRMCKGEPEDCRFPGSNYSTHSAGGCGAGLPTTRKGTGLAGKRQSLSFGHRQWPGEAGKNFGFLRL